jgi:hypothetical protein
VALSERKPLDVSPFLAYPFYHGFFTFLTDVDHQRFTEVFFPIRRGILRQIWLPPKGVSIQGPKLFPTVIDHPVPEFVSEQISQVPVVPGQHRHINPSVSEEPGVLHEIPFRPE